MLTVVVVSYDLVAANDFPFRTIPYSAAVVVVVVAADDVAVVIVVIVGTNVEVFVASRKICLNLELQDLGVVPFRKVLAVASYHYTCMSSVLNTSVAAVLVVVPAAVVDDAVVVAAGD